MTSETPLVIENSVSPRPPSLEEKYSFYKILIGILAGALLGSLLGPTAKPLASVGKFIIQLIKLLATPLVFFSILHAALHSTHEKTSETKAFSRRALTRLFQFALLNSALALGLGLLISNLLRPGDSLRSLVGSPSAIPTSLGTPASLGAATVASSNSALSWTQSLADWLSKLTPAHLLEPFLKNELLSVILIALALTFAMRALYRENRPAAERLYLLCESSLELVQILLRGILWLLPLAILAMVAATLGEHGVRSIGALFPYVLAGLIGMIIHIAVVYQFWIRIFARIPLRNFWAALRTPVAQALGTNSSLATLPLTLKGLAQLRVPRDASTLGAIVGTNLNNDGILLYEAMAVLCVAQAYGVELTLKQQLGAAAASWLAAVGIAGIPEAGVLSLTLVLSATGLPSEILPLLLSVDWILARARSATNVLSDSVLSILIQGRRPADSISGHV
jgi:Na+/H+-dicarboxylate symporter